MRNKRIHLFIVVLLFCVFSQYSLYAQLIRYSERSSGKIGFMDTNGVLVIKPIYDSMRSFKNGMYFVWLNGKAGMLSGKTRTEIIPCRYDRFRINKGGFVEITLAGKRGLIDDTGKEIVPVRFDSLQVFDNKTIEVRLQTPAGVKLGLWTWKGKELLTAEYDDIKFLAGKRYAEAIKSGKSKTIILE